jgi:hypothetical protein
VTAQFDPSLNLVLMKIKRLKCDFIMGQEILRERLIMCVYSFILIWFLLNMLNKKEKKMSIFGPDMHTDY